MDMGITHPRGREVVEPDTTRITNEDGKSWLEFQAYGTPEVVEMEIRLCVGGVTDHLVLDQARLDLFVERLKSDLTYMKWSAALRSRTVVDTKDRIQEEQDA